MESQPFLLTLSLLCVIGGLFYIHPGLGIAALGVLGALVLLIFWEH